MSLTIEDFARSSHALLGRHLTPPRFQQALTPPQECMSRLHRLREAAFDLAQEAPEVIAHPEAIRGFEQALIQALAACFADAAESAFSKSWRHAQVLDKFEALLEANPGRALYMPEICEAIGVPGRTLRNCCAETLGMSPKRYLDLRRMHLARRALLVASPKSDTVTEIATGMLPRALSIASLQCSRCITGPLPDRAICKSLHRMLPRSPATPGQNPCRLRAGIMERQAEPRGGRGSASAADADETQRGSATNSRLCSGPSACNRRFDNRRQVAAYAGLAPTPGQSGSIDSEIGRIEGR